MKSEWLRSEDIAWGRMRRFADAGYVYGLLDACDSPAVLAKVQELGAHALSLFQGTPHEAYWAQAPYLVATDAAVLDWIATELAAQSWGILILANVGIEDVRAHMQRFLVARLPDDEQWLFRYYDPRIFSVYISHCNREELAQFFGPVRGFAVPGDGGLVLVEQVAMVTPSAPPQVPLPIRAEQYQAFVQASLQNFETRALAHLCEFFPEQCQSLGDAGLRRAVAYGIERARSYGISAESEVCQYLDLMFGLGPEFDCDPNLPWAAEILHRADEPAARVAQLYGHLSKLVKGAEQNEPA